MTDTTVNLEDELEGLSSSSQAGNDTDRVDGLLGAMMCPSNGESCPLLQVINEGKSYS